MEGGLYPSGAIQVQERSRLRQRERPKGKWELHSLRRAICGFTPACKAAWKERGGGPKGPPPKVGSRGKSGNKHKKTESVLTRHRQWAPPTPLAGSDYSASASSSS